MAQTLPSNRVLQLIDAETLRAIGTPVYLMLVTIDPGDPAALTALTEVTDAGYARQRVIFAAPTIPTDGTPPNSVSTNVITFGPFTNGTSIPATHAVLVTSLTGVGGTIQWVFTLDSPASAAAGESIVGPAGIVQVSLSVGGQ